MQPMLISQAPRVLALDKCHKIKNRKKNIKYTKRISQARMLFFSNILSL